MDMNVKSFRRSSSVKSVFALLFFTVLFLQISKAQYFTVKELISVQSMNFKESDTYLSNKGWKFSHKKGGVVGKYNRNSWAFGKDTKTGGAVAWMNILSYPGSENRVVYQIQNTKNYTILVDLIVKEGMLSINTNKLENSLLTDYEGNGYVIRVIENTFVNGQKQYLFIVFTSEDYMHMNSAEEDPNDVIDQNDIF